MSGHLHGLQTKVKAEALKTIFVHFLAHCLNLVLNRVLVIFSRVQIFSSLYSYIFPPLSHENVPSRFYNNVFCRVPTMIDNIYVFTRKL